MFPFHQGGELSFQISNYLENTGITNSSSNNNNNNNTSNIYYEPTGVEQNASAVSTTHLHPAHQHGQVANKSARRGRPRRPAPSMEASNNNNEDQGGTDVAQKRIIHREIERQRRQEMAGLYSSLRSLLPMEYIRGKRSICDHITEAARYIKDLEKNINELQEKKDKLKGSCSSSGSNLHGDNVGCSSSSTSISDYTLNIHTFSGAIEIEINAGVGEEDVFPLSRVLHVLIEEGLSVVDCVSSKVNQRWIYVIRCEVSDEISIESSQLQWRLMREIGTSGDS